MLRPRSSNSLNRSIARNWPRGKQAAEKRAKEEAGKKSLPSSQNGDLKAKKVKELEAREELIRSNAREEVENRRKRLEEKFRHDLAAASRTTEKRVKEETEKKITAIVAERNLNAKKVKELEAREAQIKKQAQQEADGRFRKDLGQQRQVLEKDRDQALLKQQAGFTREREGYHKKMKDMERQVQRKTANEIGDGAEIDLFEALRDAFPGDKITRIPKGQSGADIQHEVLYKGQVCGRIIVHSKNRQGWQNAFLTKLRADRVSADADHAILSTTVFPSGKKELYIEGGVIVVSPGRVVHIVELLRNAVVRMHTLGLSLRQRASKVNQLYKFMTSQEYLQRFTELGRLADDISDLDVEETKEHQRVWKRRGATVTRLKNVLREIDTDVSAILEGSDVEELQVAEAV